MTRIWQIKRSGDWIYQGRRRRAQRKALVLESIELSPWRTSIHRGGSRLLLRLTVKLPPLMIGELLESNELLLASGADHSTFTSSLLDCGASIAPPSSSGRYLWEKVVDEVVWHC
jgi:hypothetical protein